MSDRQPNRTVVNASMQDELIASLLVVCCRPLSFVRFDEACSGACEEFADECQRHDAEHCQVTAEVLRACAESCGNMMTA